MQSTGHSSIHARSFTSTQGKAMTQVTWRYFLPDEVEQSVYARAADDPGCIALRVARPSVGCGRVVNTARVQAVVVVRMASCGPRPQQHEQRHRQHSVLPDGAER